MRNILNVLPRQEAGKIEDHINSTQPFRDVMLVGGARQVGKSTLVESLLAKARKPIISVNLAERRSVVSAIDQHQDFGDFENYLRDVFGFNPSAGQVLFIDEAQLSERLGSFVRFMKEKWEHTSVILSGSMINNLFRDRFPVGRVQKLILRPFTFEEYLQAQNKLSLLECLHSYKLGQDITETRHLVLIEELDRYCRVGGLPAVITELLRQGDWLDQRDRILGNYYEDFKLYFGSDSHSLAAKAFQAVCFNVASPSKFTQVLAGQERGYHRIAEIFSCLESWDLVLHSIQKGPQPETDLHPKRYLFDVGIVQQLRYTAKPLAMLAVRTDPSVDRAVGGLLEQFVAGELIFLFSKLSGFRSPNYEVDFMPLIGEEVVPLEVKAALKNKKSFAKCLKCYCDTYKIRRAGCLTLARPATFSGTDSTVFFLPAYLAGQVKRLFA